MTKSTRTTTRPPASDLASFLEGYQTTLRSVFRERAEEFRVHTRRGLPPSLMRELLGRSPLSVFIPEAHGGRGEKIHEVVAVLDVTAYESLPMCLTLGINGALFLQPVSKYGDEELKRKVFHRFLAHQNMGGLMMTEPAYGSDALNMETSYTDSGRGSYLIRGTKHWGGLTGLADYWLVVARSRAEDGALGRDVSFFVCDTHDPKQRIVVEEEFSSLGLLAIPYGRNRIDAEVPLNHRLQPRGTGLKMMLDLLHRSRMQFPAMGVGFLRRMFDEALAHSRERRVGGKSLIDYDQVRRRLARLQALVTAATAMCVYASEHAGVHRDLSKEGIAANANKAIITDFMYEAADSLLQLVGAKGYRFDHIAGRSLLDSRPFQIFEGSNDILYEQLAQSILNLGLRGKHATLNDFLRSFKASERASEYVSSFTDFRLDTGIPQRKLVDLGRIVSRVLTMESVIELGARGYRDDLVDNCLEQLGQEAENLVSVFQGQALTTVIDEFASLGAWLSYVRSSS